MGMFFVPLKLNVYFPTWEFDLCQWSKMGRYRVQKPVLICFSEKWIFLRLKTGEVIWSTFPVVPLRLLHVGFSNTALAHLSFNTRSPPYSFKIFGLFALTTPVAILMTWHLLMTLPAILVPSAVSLAFFSIPESNRLSLPILLTTVQSPSLHFFFQMLTVVLTKEYFRYIVVNFLIVQAVSNPLAYSPACFLIFAEISTWYFFGLLYIFWISSSA